MRARRILLLLTAWLSFDLATPLPGAFEFEIQDSEIEQSLHARSETHAKRAAATSRSDTRERVEPARRSRPPVLPRPAIATVTGETWVRHVRLAHRPSSRRASTASLEDH